MLGSFPCPILASNLVRPSLVTPLEGIKEGKLQYESPRPSSKDPPPHLPPPLGLKVHPHPSPSPGTACPARLTIKHHHEDGLRAQALAPAAGL